MSISFGRSGSAVPPLVSLHKIGQCFDVSLTVIQCGDVVVLFPPGGEEVFPILFAYLLQGLQAVGRKAGADHMDPFDPAGAPLFQGFIGIGLKPGLSPDPRLEGDGPLFR